MNPDSPQNRRHFLKSATVAASFFIVPRYVLGGKRPNGTAWLAPSDRINLGFIGLGKQVGGLRRQFLTTGETQIVAACDVDKSKIAPFVDAVNKHYAEGAGKQTYDACQSYADFREVLNRKDIDAVVIATPDHWHGVMGVRAAEAGKDIYCEKPLSLTVEEGRAMVKAARKHKRVFQTGSMQRSWPEFRQAVELVRNGYIGEIKTVNVNVGGPPKEFDLPAETLPDGVDWPFWLGPNVIERPYNNKLLPPTTASFWGQWRAYRDFGGGGMTDWGAHMFDIAQWGLGMDDSGPVELLPPAKGAEKGLVYTYANGVRMIHQPVEGKQFCQFIGTEGEVKVARGELITTPASLKDKVMGEGSKRVYFSENHYRDFLNAIRSRKNPICDVEIGHRTATVCTIGNIAYALGRPLRWNPEKEKFTGDAEANRMLGRPMKKEWKI